MAELVYAAPVEAPELEQAETYGFDSRTINQPNANEVLFRCEQPRETLVGLRNIVVDAPVKETHHRAKRLEAAGV